MRATNTDKAMKIMRAKAGESVVDAAKRIVRERKQLLKLLRQKDNLIEHLQLVIEGKRDA